MKVAISFCFLICCTLAKGQAKIDTTYNVNGRNISLRSTNLSEYRLQLKSITNDNEITFDTLLYTNSITYFELLLFDNDPYPDLLTCYLGNNPYFVLHLYNPKMQAFIEVDQYHNFPDSKRLEKQSGIYYSYRRAGCVDRNWVSDLYKLKNFTITHLAHIYGQGCDANIDDEPQKIDIFKVSAEGKQELLDTLDYNKNISNKSDKWDFIRKYWNENIEKFN